MRGLLSKRRLVVGTVIVLFLFSLNLVSSQVRGVVTTISSPLQGLLWRMGGTVSTFLAGGSLAVEKETLRQKNFALLAEVAALQDLKAENEELRKVLQFGLIDEFDLVLGEIIGKTLGQDVIVIRGGQDKGIREGMPVITASKVVVGKVVESFATHARIQLISASESKLDAQVAGTGATGVVRGQGSEQLLLDWVPQGDKFHTGDVVITSNLGDVFPENLLIGEVGEILQTGADPFQKASVKPFFTIKSAETVFVITSTSL